MMTRSGGVGQVGCCEQYFFHRRARSGWCGNEDETETNNDDVSWGSKDDNDEVRMVKTQE
jgi:hypothetical protein